MTLFTATRAAEIASSSDPRRAWTLPCTAAQRSMYRSSLCGLLADLLSVSVRLARDPTGTQHPQLGVTVRVPSASRLRFTADGWARLELRIDLLAAITLMCIEDRLAASRPDLARLSMHARIAESVDNEHLFLEWRSPRAGAARQRLNPAAGAATQSDGPRALTLSLPLQGEEPSAQALRFRRPRRSRSPRRITVQKIYRDETRLPALRLSGNWLSQLGFTERQKIAVIAKKGRIVLSLVPPPPT